MAGGEGVETFGRVVPFPASPLLPLHTKKDPNSQMSGHHKPLRMPALLSQASMDGMLKQGLEVRGPSLGDTAVSLPVLNTK